MLLLTFSFFFFGEGEGGLTADTLQLELSNVGIAEVRVRVYTSLLTYDRFW